MKASLLWVALGLSTLVTLDRAAATVRDAPCIENASLTTCIVNGVPLSVAGGTAIAQGYVTPSDGGGGSFTDIGVCDADAYTVGGSSTVPAGSTTIPYSATGQPQPAARAAVEQTLERAKRLDEKTRAGDAL